MTPEEYVQQELSWYHFCPVCGAELVSEMSNDRRFDLTLHYWVDITPYVTGKKCPKGHGDFSVDYHTTFNLNKNSE